MSNEIMTRDEMKELAVGYMKDLKIFKPYIKDFEKDGVVTMFERYAGYWAWQYPELDAKIKEFEELHGSLVYAVTHEYTKFGEFYDFLCVSKYREDKDYNIEDYGEDGTGVWAWVWNKSMPDCSEFGTIGVKSFGGGITRIW